MNHLTCGKLFSLAIAKAKKISLKGSMKEKEVIILRRSDIRQVPVCWVNDDKTRFPPTLSAQHCRCHSHYFEVCVIRAV